MLPDAFFIMNKSQTKIAILISNAGTGTNLQAIIDGIESKKIRAGLGIVVSDTDDAQGLLRAKKHHIPTHVLRPKENLTELLQITYPVDYVVLAGWKKIIPNAFIDAFPDRILNLHPGLIPDTINGKVQNPDGTEGLWNRGKFTDIAIQNFITQKSTYAGSSIHLLTNEFDFGPVLGRCFEKIQPEDTIETLYKRLKIKENSLYVDVLRKLCTI
jgi:phosphoribosylglycinamide formyltransferase 1